MKKLLSFVMSFSLFATFAFGASVSQEDAFNKASTFKKVAQKTNLFKTKNIESQLKLAYTATNNDINTLYVFNIGVGEGYVIVSGDDTTQPILGYSDEGEIDYANLPDGLKYLLGEYSLQVAYSATHSNNNYNLKSEENETLSNSVAPLLGNTAWNQDSPYNDMCPIYNKNLHSASGCAATAMAQILYYHKWPKIGKGTHSYTPTQYDMGTLTVDFSKSEYGWNNMLSSYNSESSAESKAAVAKLMYDCGVAISMEYGAQSGALSRNWGYALVNYFDYDKGVAYRNRNNYGIKEWDDIIVNEINNKRPVYATGFSSSGGHAFVFDGYDSNGFIHVNWGWGAMSNGYFRTTALTPASQGIGGSNGGFNYTQSIFTGIAVPAAEAEYSVELVSSEALQPSSTKFDKQSKITIKLNGKITNVGWQGVTCDLGLGIFDENDNLVEVREGEKNINIDLDGVKYGTNFSSIDFASLSNGNYRIFPIAKMSNGSNWVKIRDSYVVLPNYLSMKVEDSGISLSAPEYYSLKASNIQIKSKIYSKAGTLITATITNQSKMEYYGEVKVALYNKSTKKKIAESSGYIVDLKGGESEDVNFTDSYSVDAGDYYLAIIDDDMTKLNDFVPVTILPATGVTAILQTTKKLSFDNNENVPIDDIHISADIKCVEGVFGGSVYVYLYDEDGTTTMGCLNPENANIEEGETVTVNFKGTFENGEVGKTYRAYLVNGEQLVFITPKDLASCTFRLGAPSGVEYVEDNVNALKIYLNTTDNILQIKCNTPINKIEIFSLSGELSMKEDCAGAQYVSKDISSLASGLYILKVDSSQGCNISKIIKR